MIYICLQSVPQETSSWGGSFSRLAGIFEASGASAVNLYRLNWGLVECVAEVPELDQLELDTIRMKWRNFSNVLGPDADRRVRGEDKLCMQVASISCECLQRDQMELASRLLRPLDPAGRIALAEILRAGRLQRRASFQYSGCGNARHTHTGTGARTDESAYEQLVKRLREDVGRPWSRDPYFFACLTPLHIGLTIVRDFYAMAEAISREVKFPRAHPKNKKPCRAATGHVKCFKGFQSHPTSGWLLVSL